MLELTTWNVYKADGHFIGQTEAYTPRTALCRCMAVSGNAIDEADVKTDLLDDQAVQAWHRGETFILRLLTRAGHNRTDAAPTM